MKKHILLFLFTISATAQIKGVVRDSITKEPKSYENLLMRKYHNKCLTPSIIITLTN